MDTAFLQRRTANWMIPIILAAFLTSAAGFTVVRAVVLLGQLSSLATQSGAERMHPSQIQP
jgi:hypothetical protein